MHAFLRFNCLTDYRGDVNILNVCYIVNSFTMWYTLTL